MKIVNFNAKWSCYKYEDTPQKSNFSLKLHVNDKTSIWSNISWKLDN